MTDILTPASEPTPSEDRWMTILQFTRLLRKWRSKYVTRAESDARVAEAVREERQQFLALIDQHECLSDDCWDNLRAALRARSDKELQIELRHSDHPVDRRLGRDMTDSTDAPG